MNDQDKRIIEMSSDILLLTFGGQRDAQRTINNIEYAMKQFNKSGHDAWAFEVSKYDSMIRDLGTKVSKDNILAKNISAKFKGFPDMTDEEFNQAVDLAYSRMVNNTKWFAKYVNEQFPLKFVNDFNKIKDAGDIRKNNLSLSDYHSLEDIVFDLRQGKPVNNMFVENVAKWLKQYPNEIKIEEHDGRYDLSLNIQRSKDKGGR